MDPVRLIVIFIAAVVAGAVNAIAGGGTVFSFTALAWAGLPLINANATNATALVPGSVGGVVAFRRELRPQWRSLLILFIPTLVGSLAGAFTVVNTSEFIFRAIVPFLVLFATLIFASRNVITRWARRAAPQTEHITPTGYLVGCLFQFVIAFYGGYFGAGIGILMLTALNIIGMHDIIKMNALKNALAIVINGTASLFFLQAGKVDIPIALLGAVGSIIGGYVLASYARRLDQNVLRIVIITAGIIVSAWLFIRLMLT